MTGAEAREDPDTFMFEVKRICARYPGLEPLAGGILAATTMEIAQDSRSFARTFGVEHALVLRAAHVLSDAGLLAITRRIERNQRSYFATTPLFQA